MIFHEEKKQVLPLDTTPTRFVNLHKSPPRFLSPLSHKGMICLLLLQQKNQLKIYKWLKYSLLVLPGVLNWEVSRNFRGVDKLVTSIRGTGEESFTSDLREGKELKETVDYYLQYLFTTNNPLIPYILSLRNTSSHFYAFCQLLNFSKIL